MTTSRRVTAPLLGGTHTGYAAPWGLEGHLTPDRLCVQCFHTHFYDRLLLQRDLADSSLWKV